MERTVFEGQENFIKDYRRVVKEDDRTDTEIAEAVVREMDVTFTHHYTLPAEKTNTRGAYSFPFDKQIYSEDMESTLKTRYIYIGDPVEIDSKEDEQM